MIENGREFVIAVSAALTLLSTSAYGAPPAAAAPAQPVVSPSHATPHAPPLAKAGVCSATEISQQCALVGCFPGDSPGFPVTITHPNAYSLCSNLVVPDKNTTAIEITAHHVTIDLKGFSISGPVVCSSSDGKLTCNTTGSGKGIDAHAATDVAVRDGTVHGMGDVGVVVGPASRVERIRAISNGASGIQFTERTALIADNTVLSNHDHGILGSQRSIIRGNVIAENGRDGINTQEYCLVSDNLSSRNGNDGIVSGCVATIVGNKTTSNKGNGITTCGAASVSGNTSHENQGAALKIGSGSCSGNTLGGSLSGTCKALTPNLCGNTLCP
jgi:hypothetical protein